MTSESQEPNSSTSTRKRRARKQVAATERTGKRYLGEILIANGAITENELNVALAQQNSTGGRLGEVLLTLKLVRATDLLKAVAEQNSVEFIDLDTITMDPDLLGPMTSGRCRRLNAVPVKRNPDGSVTVAMANPGDLIAIDDIAAILGTRVTPAQADLSQLNSLLDRIDYGNVAVADALQRAAADTSAAQSSAATADLRGLDEGPIAEFVDNMITLARQLRASDIHIEPTSGSTRVRFRVDGVLREVYDAPAETHAALVSRIKVFAGLNIAERRLPQDGRLSMSLLNGEAADMRVATVPTVHGEAVSIRLISQDSTATTLDRLGFIPDTLDRFRQMIHLPHGAVLVTGPTGSGKTTTLYAAIQDLNDPTRHILTAEDPVEVRIEGVKQMQVNPSIGLSFASALRSFLRLDPDVIMVGEIRDIETARIAIEASLTGHQVLSSMHTNDAASTPLRLLEMGMEPFYVLSSLNGVVSQRLVRRLCECKSEDRATDAEMQSLDIPEDYLKPDGSFTVYRAVGCPTCSSTGYKGRFAVHEVMVIDDTVRELIAARSPAKVVREAAIDGGMITLHEDGLWKVATGFSSLSEVMRVVI